MSLVVAISSPDCHDRWLQPHSSRRPRGHVTYRDKASQGLCKSARPSFEHTTEELELRPPTPGLGSHGVGRLAAQSMAPPATGDVFEYEPDFESLPGEIVDGGQVTPQGPSAEPEQDIAQDGDDDGDDEMPEITPEPVLLEAARPSLSEYKEKWNSLFLRHTRAVKGAFKPNNLVPKPVPQLFQDCPWVPFDVLTAADASDEAHARLSRCIPLSGLQPSSMAGGAERYAHCQGEVSFRCRAPMQVAATLGFILGQRSGKFLKGLKPKELDAIHEILTWGAAVVEQ